MTEFPSEESMERAIERLRSQNPEARIVRGMIPQEPTPAMIDAGVDVLVEFEWGWSNANDYAEKIWRAVYEMSESERTV